MKNNKFLKWIFLFISLSLLTQNINAQSYTSTYNGVSYSSAQPYNLNVVYFVPNDIPFDTTYKTRLSAILIWGQNYFKQNMISNGYGPKTFGLFKETANPNNVKIIVIHGAYPHTSYTYNDASKMVQETNAYFTNNPTQKNSDHTLFITAVADASTANVPFYGSGTNCYALDYPQFDIQYLGTDTYTFTGWFGGMMHELGHGLNLPHCAETKTEHDDPNKGVTLMSFGNMSLGKSPTFVNRAGCAILNNCQVFADAPGTSYYNGSTATLSSLHTTYSNGELIVSGTFQSNRVVKDVNIYQNPTQYPAPGNNSIAWSVPPTGNSFNVHMPVSELTYTNQNYYLGIQLVLENGESSYEYFPYSYVNGVPTPNIDIESITTCIGTPLQLSTNISGSSYQWQYQSGNGSWVNYPEGGGGLATFSGTQTNTMTISNISNFYISNPNKARVTIIRPDGSTAYSQIMFWKAKEAPTITTQPAASTTACVGSSIQLTSQASDQNATYQWQYQNGNGTWSDYPEGNVAGFATFAGTQTKAMTISNISAAYITNPNQVRVFVTSASGCTVASNTVTWKAKEAVTITTQPAASTTACVGSSIQLVSQASDQNATYQWQYQNTNGTWSNYQDGNVAGFATFTGTQTKTMTISNISAAYINYPNQVRVFVTSASGCTVASNTVTWKAKEAVTITTQPAASTTACVGSSIQLVSQASDQNATYQWQYQNANGTWSNYPEGNVAGFATFTGTQTKAMTISNISAAYITNPNQVRVFVTSTSGCTVASNTVTWKAQNCTARPGKDNIDEIKITMANDQTVYPNPVKDELTVNLGTVKDDYQVEIIGSLGQVIYKAKTSDQTLKVLLSDKPAGIYIVNIKGAKTGSNKSIKIIKK